MNFNDILQIHIPEGDVASIMIDDKIVWRGNKPVIYEFFKLISIPEGSTQPEFTDSDTHLCLSTYNSYTAPIDIDMYDINIEAPNYITRNALYINLILCKQYEDGTLSYSTPLPTLLIMPLIEQKPISIILSEYINEIKSEPDYKQYADYNLLYININAYVLSVIGYMKQLEWPSLQVLSDYEFYINIYKK